MPWLLVLLACGRTPPPGPDVLVVILDTVRVDLLSKERTPRILEHAEGSWHPVQAWSPSSWTLPAVVALLTGRPPWEVLGEGDASYPPGGSICQEIPDLRCEMISANPYVTKSRGFDRAFDFLHEVQSDKEAVARALEAWALPGRKAVWVHLVTPHLPYEPTRVPPGATPRVGDKFWDLDGWESYDAADRARIAALYAAGLADLDDRVGELLDGVGPGTITALISDHGEELFEQDGFEHGHAFWEEVTRIHAAISVPGVAPSRPLKPLQIHHVGRVLGAWLQGTVPEALDLPKVLGFSHPLSTRATIRHTWGARDAGGVLFLGEAGGHKEGASGRLAATIQDMKVGLPAARPAPEIPPAERKRLEALGYAGEAL
jgi:hypothetical protein